MTSSSAIHSDLIRTLMYEHLVISRALLVLKHTIQTINKRQPPPLADCRTLIRFFKQYADRIHHYSEEELLFVALQRTRDISIRTMIDKLSTQHVIGRMLVAQMDESLADARLARRGWRSKFIENGRAYNTLLTIHICDEDHVFFPAADRTLSKRRTARARLRAPQVPTKHAMELSIARLERKLGLKPICSECGEIGCGSTCEHSVAS